jgi:ketosteroid isomerase-like protein
MITAFCLLVFTPIVSAGPIEDSVQMSREWANAFNEGNAEALSALYAPDAVLTTWQDPFRLKVETRFELRWQDFSDPTQPDSLQ